MGELEGKMKRSYVNGTKVHFTTGVRLMSLYLRLVSTYDITSGTVKQDV